VHDDARRVVSLRIVAQRHRAAWHAEHEQARPREIARGAHVGELAVHALARLARSSRVASNSFDAEDGTHTVQRGDTLGTIATRYGLSLGELKRLNDLSSNLIHPGERLKVKDTPAAAPATARASTSEARRYRVASGDTLGRIADAHGVGLSSLLRANGLSRRSTIYPGQWLVIPR
jgi:LysM repeat protein